MFNLAHKKVIEIYKVTESFPQQEIFGITSQMRRAAYSITSNLIEGSVKSEKKFHHYVKTALGSAEELRYFIRLSCDLTYLSKKKYNDLTKDITGIIKQLNSLSQRTG